MQSHDMAGGSRERCNSCQDRSEAGKLGGACITEAESVKLTVARDFLVSVYFMDLCTL
jgi:hypothetical protein